MNLSRRRLFLGAAGLAVANAVPKALTSALTVTKVADTYKVSGTITANRAMVITEAAIFDAVDLPRGRLILSNFAPINVVANDTVCFTLSAKRT